MKTLKELNEELDAFNATLNDENEDTPEKPSSLTSPSARRASIWRRDCRRRSSSPRLTPCRPSHPSRHPLPPLSLRPSAQRHTPPRMASTDASCARNCALLASKLRTASLMSRKW
jgi:hypothetical protein